jgi:hypothetical protein
MQFRIPQSGRAAPRRFAYYPAELTARNYDAACGLKKQSWEKHKGLAANRF